MFLVNFEVVPHLMSKSEAMTVFRETEEANDADGRAGEMLYPAFVELVGRLAVQAFANVAPMLRNPATDVTSIVAVKKLVEPSLENCGPWAPSAPSSADEATSSAREARTCREGAPSSPGYSSIARSTVLVRARGERGANGPTRARTGRIRRLDSRGSLGRRSKSRPGRSQGGVRVPTIPESRVPRRARAHARIARRTRASGTRASPQVGSALAIPRQATRERHASRGSRRLPRCGRTIRRREKSLARRRGCRRRGRGRGGGGGALSSRISSRARRRRGRRVGAGGVARPSARTRAVTSAEARRGPAPPALEDTRGCPRLRRRTIGASRRSTT